MGIYFSFYAVSLSPTFEKALGLLTIVLRPPSLIAVLCIDCEGVQQLVFWAFIALINCGLYAAVGFLILWLRRIGASTAR
jgi:nitrate reductase gamma subunit